MYKSKSKEVTEDETTDLMLIFLKLSEIAFQLELALGKAPSLN
jgi:hypothetical protein